MPDGNRMQLSGFYFRGKPPTSKVGIRVTIYSQENDAHACGKEVAAFTHAAQQLALRALNFHFGRTQTDIIRCLRVQVAIHFELSKYYAGSFSS